MTTPKNQTSEVLNLLLKSKQTSLNLISNGILNPGARIANLRAMGVNIICNYYQTINKFGRLVKFGEFSILNKKDSRKIYTRIN